MILSKLERDQFEKLVRQSKFFVAKAEKDNPFRYKMAVIVSFLLILPMLYFIYKFVIYMLTSGI